jgi:hypothetical protein
MSLPEYRPELQPSEVDPNRIRVIHHGMASPGRQLEIMLEVHDHLDERFHFDIMLAKGGDRRYVKYLQSEVEKRPRCRLIPPVTFEQLVPFSNGYDIGMFLVPPVNFSLEYCLPNKLFEFLQARLMVAIGPSPDMAKVVRDANAGIVSEKFCAHDLARRLNALSAEEIMQFKRNAQFAARRYSHESNRERLRKLPGEIIASASAGRISPRGPSPSVFHSPI